MARISLLQLPTAVNTCVTETEDWVRNINSLSLGHVSIGQQLKDSTHLVDLDRAQLHQNSFQYMPGEKLKD